MASDVEVTKQVFDKIVMEESVRSPTLLPWDRFQNWIHCICVVTFDLELGQAMEVTSQDNKAYSSSSTSTIDNIFSLLTLSLVLSRVWQILTNK